MSAGADHKIRLKPGITLYLIRHGETDWNKAQRYQGQADIPLNDTGRAQARRNGEVLSASVPDVASFDFVASPLSRAIETMDILRAAISLEPKSYRIDDRLMELHYGHWEGHLATELPRFDPMGVAAKLADPFGWRPDGGESYRDLLMRTRTWLETLTRTTVAVTHGGVSRVARGALLPIADVDIPTLDVPQDRILVLEDGTMRWL
ncbi:MAG: histidine phosphatase family protein [Hyphomicrobium sp.]